MTDRDSEPISRQEVDKAIQVALARHSEEINESLSAQEHRPVHATVNLVGALVRRQWFKIPTRAGAFVASVILRPAGLVSVGLLAIATSLLTAVQVVLLENQNRLLESQNLRIDIQTAVAEAGRRQEIAAAARSIIDEMIAEREKVLAETPRPSGIPTAGERKDQWGHLECIPHNDPEFLPELCLRVFRRWPSDTVFRHVPRQAVGTSTEQERPTDEIISADFSPSPMPRRCFPTDIREWPYGRGCPVQEPTRLVVSTDFEDSHRLPAPPLWYPSARLAIRLANLTKQLRPHRPVVVDEETSSCPLRGSRATLINSLHASGESPPIELLDWGDNTAWAQAARSVIEDMTTSSQEDQPSSLIWQGLRHILTLISPPIPNTYDVNTVTPRVRFSCVRGSPERADILLSMIEAGIHPDAVVARGGMFENSVFDGVRVNDRVFEGIDLSGSIFMGGSVIRNVLLNLVPMYASAFRDVNIQGLRSNSSWQWDNTTFYSVRIFRPRGSISIFGDLINDVRHRIVGHGSNVPRSFYIQDTFDEYARSASTPNRFSERELTNAVQNFCQDVRSIIEPQNSIGPDWASTTGAILLLLGPAAPTNEPSQTRYVQEIFVPDTTWWSVFKVEFPQTQMNLADVTHKNRRMFVRYFPFSACLTMR